MSGKEGETMTYFNNPGQSQGQSGEVSGHFTSQTVNEAINQNAGLQGNNASLSVFGVLPEQVIATDMLIAAKHGVTCCARAITEASTPQLKETLKRHLDAAIAAHDTISQFMGSKGWYDAANPQHMIQMDMQCTDDALKLQSQTQ
jgi:similar to spore coat protein